MKRSPIKHRSTKKATADRLYAANRATRIEYARGLCEAHTPACPPHSHPGHQTHHRLPRGAGVDHSVSNLLLAATKRCSVTSTDLRMAGNPALPLPADSSTAHVASTGLLAPEVGSRPCGAIDPITGAVCDQPPDHPGVLTAADWQPGPLTHHLVVVGRHADGSDLGCILAWAIGGEA